MNTRWEAGWFSKLVWALWRREEKRRKDVT
jgi:hypothetical protein